MKNQICITSNQLGQTVRFFASKYDEGKIVATVNNVRTVTGFYDLEDFFEPNSTQPSEYMPVLVGDKIMSYGDTQ